MKPWPADHVERWSFERIRRYARNARTHSQTQIERLAASMREFGWTNPMLLDETGEIIAGHGRLSGAEFNQEHAVELNESASDWQEAPVMIATGWSEEQKRAYRLADNRLALDAGWDEDLLKLELQDLKAADFDLELTGFDKRELTQLQLFGAPPLGEGEPEPPEPEAVAITRAGEVWVLGRHRVMCGDARNAADLARLMDGRRAKLLHADPPYGMGKEALGVQNDNLYGDKLDEFQLAWWRTCRAHLEANGSAYIWGAAPDLWRLWWKAGLGESEPLTLRNEIVWDKQSIAGMRSADLTQYPEASERCLFFQLGRHVFLINQTKDDYWEGWEPLRTWMVEQRDAAAFTAADVKRICGNHMYGHWFGKSQWAFISEENYEKLKTAAGGKAFAKPYAEILIQYRQLAREFNGEVHDPREQNYRAGRPYFDNSHDVMRDVWTFPRVSGEERLGHATPKPVAMMERVMRSSLREREMALEPFGGTGTTLIAAHRAERDCCVMELDPRYVDVIVRRWQGLTGDLATLEGSGEHFDRVADARKKTEAELPGSH